MATNVVMTIVMAVTVDAHADTDATNLNAYYGSVGRACAQQGQGKNRGDKGFHDSSLSGDASSASFADADVDSSPVMESRRTTIRSKAYRQAHLRNSAVKKNQSLRPLRRRIARERQWNGLGRVAVVIR